jgi:nicotinate phosphoribosyltransferase
MTVSDRRRSDSWVNDANMALLTDQYELTMLQAYWREGMTDDAVFSLFSRRLPEHRSFLLACGLDDALHYLERVSFTDEVLGYLADQDEFSDGFLRWLEEFRFTGSVYAVPEGTPVFADEPLLEVVAPLPEAQLAESFVMNQVHFQTVIASKAARVVEASRGCAVVDFGLRRMHGADAAVKAARAFHVAGVDATSNMLAGHLYGIPVSGTMAHSYIQAHDDEADAFRAFSALYPETILLVDTYDTLDGVEKVVRLAEELGSDFALRGVRLDSGDLGTLADEARALLDRADLERVSIFASGGLDEFAIADLLEDGAPIDGFGVGTGMGVSDDAPALDMAYKLTAYAGTGRLKLSSGKRILPGRKQVFRIERDGRAMRDVIAREGEALPGRPLLEQVMRDGQRLPAGAVELGRARERARDEIRHLPDAIRSIDPPAEPYPVEVSDALRAYQHDVAEQVSGCPIPKP